MINYKIRKLAVLFLLMIGLLCSACSTNEPGASPVKQATNASPLPTGGARTVSPGETLDLTKNLPAGFQATNLLHVRSDGLFMHADGALKFGPFRAPARTCFLSRAFIDSKVSQLPGGNGVEFVYYIILADTQRTIASKRIPLDPTESSEIVVELPADEAFMLQLVTSDRGGNGKNDWSIWGNPRLGACP